MHGSKTVVDIIVKDDLSKNAEKMGGYLMENLKERNLKVRGRGLMIGVDVLNAERTVLELIERGVLTIYSKNTLRILPPLIIEKKHADEFLKAIDTLDKI